MNVDPPPVCNVLFLCTGNSARSILGEALLNRLGGGRFRAYSAGSQPKGQLHPLALQVLHDAGLSTDGLRSKAWEDFAAPAAPVMDLVITVCDAAANEACPVWPGRPATAHWGQPDPAAVTGSDAECLAAFETALQTMQRRIGRLVALPADAFANSELAAQLAAVGRD